MNSHIRAIVALAALLLPASLQASPADCFSAAKLNNLFSEHSYEMTMHLCQGSGSAGTVQCFQDAKTLFRVAPERKALALCAGSPDSSPVTCYRDAYNQVAGGTPGAQSRHAMRLCSYKEGAR